MFDIISDFLELQLEVPDKLIISLVEQSRIVEPLPGYLQLLPIEDRWEHQRRHPYYCLFRTHANHWLQFLNSKDGGGESDAVIPARDDDEFRAWNCAHQVIQHLGLNGYLPSPRKRWDEIESVIGDDRAGARNVTRFELVVELMKDIDDRQAKIVSTLLRQAAKANQEGKKPSRADHRFDALRRLNNWLGEAPKSEFLAINRFAQKEQVTKDVITTYDLLRSEVDVTHKRVHADNVERDLRIWDLREGWADGRYDPSLEHSLVQIAEGDDSLNSVSSARNSYVAAFKRVIGSDYSPENWFWTVGILKLKTTGFGAISAARPQRTKARREVAASKAKIDVNAWQPTARETASSVLLLKEAILELRSDGFSNGEIASTTDLSVDAIGTFFEHIESGDIST